MSLLNDSVNGNHFFTFRKMLWIYFFFQEKSFNVKRYVTKRYVTPHKRLSCGNKAPLRQIKAIFALSVARRRINMSPALMRGKSLHKRLWIRLCGRAAMRRHWDIFPPLNLQSGHITLMLCHFDSNSYIVGIAFDIIVVADQLAHPCCLNRPYTVGLLNSSSHLIFLKW